MFEDIHYKMAKRNQIFLHKWLDDPDEQILNGTKTKIGDWAKPSKDVYKAFCSICNYTISVLSMGKQSLIKHAGTVKHKTAMGATTNQPKFNYCQNSTPTNFDEQVLKAEMRWAAFLADHDLAPNISVDAQKLFCAMFPDSKIATSFTCARTKASYLISDGYGPILHSETVEQMQKKKFSLMLDESNKVFSNKYLHLLVRYSNDGRVQTRFYKALSLDKSTANDIVELISKSFEKDKIPWKNLVQIMSDSPNVMRGKDNGVIVQIRKKFAPNIIDIGGCSLHHIHNAVSYATASLGEDIEDFAVNVFAFFKHRTGLCKDFKNVQAILDIAEHRVLRFVSTRWLSVLPVVDRLVEQYEALKTFFENLKTENPHVAKQERTRKISKQLNDPVLYAKLCFLKASLPRLQKFEKLFQSNDTLVHVLHVEMFELVKNIMVDFLDPALLCNITTARQLVNIQYTDVQHHLKDGEIAIGDSTFQTLQRMTEGQRHSFILDVKKFYMTLVEKLLKYLPLECQVLEDLKSLCPVNSKAVGLNPMKRLSKTVKLLDQTIDIDEVDKEWRRYSIESYDETRQKNLDVFSYWNEVLNDTYQTGSPKYTELRKVIMPLLSLCHGNADTERTFSKTTNILTKHRNSLGIETLNGLMAIESEMRNNDVQAHDIILSKARLEAGRNAYSTYELRHKNPAREEKRKEPIRSVHDALKETSDLNKKEQNLNQNKKKAKELNKKVDNLIKDLQSTRKIAEKTQQTIANDEKQITEIKKKKGNRCRKRKSVAADSYHPVNKQPWTERRVNEPTFDKTYVAISNVLNDKFCIDKIIGDGNCLFRAVSKSLFGSENFHDQVRQDTVSFMRRNEAVFRRYIDGDIEKHMEDMKRLATWGTEAEIFAMASLYSRDIFVLTSINDVYKWTLFRPKIKSQVAPNMAPPCKCHITLCHPHGNHYDRVSSQSGGCNCTMPKPTIEE